MKKISMHDIKPNRKYITVLKSENPNSNNTYIELIKNINYKHDSYLALAEAADGKWKSLDFEHYSLSIYDFYEYNDKNLLELVEDAL